MNTLPHYHRKHIAQSALSFLYLLVFAAMGMFVLAPKAYAQVVINELYPKPSDETLEWIELYNAGNDTVSMNQWTISNSNGEAKSFILNASAIIPGRGWYLLQKSQSGINMSIDGDTITLKNDRGETIDTQTYPGTLGFNTAYGRGPDGGIGMTICTVGTPGAANNCPVPTPSPTPTEAPPPQQTLPPETPPPPPPPAYQPVVQNDQPIEEEPIKRIVIEPQVLGLVSEKTPTPTLPPGMVRITLPNSFVLSKSILIQALIVIGAWILLGVIAYLNRKKKKPHHPQQHNPTG